MCGYRGSVLSVCQKRPQTDLATDLISCVASTVILKDPVLCKQRAENLIPLIYEMGLISEMLPSLRATRCLIWLA